MTAAFSELELSVSRPFPVSLSSFIFLGSFHPHAKRGVFLKKSLSLNLEKLLALDKKKMKKKNRGNGQMWPLAYLAG